MASPETFAIQDPADLRRLIEAAPLAWIASPGPERFCATPLPLRPKDGDGGELVLQGHFARSNPHVETLRRDPRALVLFMGPNGYVSPSWMADRTQAPTWNYAAAQFQVEISFFDDEARTRAAVADLAEAMEAGRPRAWAVSEMGERFGRLARGVVGFEARILDWSAKFKLGQDERADVYDDIEAGLREEGAGDLLTWMGRYNDGRAGG